jgi:hypothetical protein
LHAKIIALGGAIFSPIEWLFYFDLASVWGGEGVGSKSNTYEDDGKKKERVS